MKKLIYYTRVTLVSFEFLLLITFVALYLIFAATLEQYHGSIRLNQEAVGWLNLYPFALTAWILKEGQSLLFPDDKIRGIIHKWPDYWKLKAHFDIGILYAVAISFIMLLIWLFNVTESMGGKCAFVACLIIISVDAYSFYSAKIALDGIAIEMGEYDQ